MARPIIGTSGWTSSASGTLTRLTTEGLSNERAEWSPDGRRVLFRSDRDGRTAIWWRPADLSAEASVLLSGNRLDVFEAVMSPDARSLVFQLDTGGADLYYRSMAGDTSPKPIANSQTAIETMPRLSPDGRWVAFTTNESGRDEVVVQPFPGPGGRVQVSTAGGTEPVWSRDGRRLFYRGERELMAAVIRPGPGFTVAARDTVLTDTYMYADQSARQLRRDAGRAALHLPRAGQRGRADRGGELGVGAAGADGGRSCQVTMERVCCVADSGSLIN